MGGRKHKKTSGKKKKKNGVAIAASAKKSRKRRTSLKISNHDVMEKLAKKRLTPSESGVLRIYANSNKASDAKLFKRRPNISSQDVSMRVCSPWLIHLSQGFSLEPYELEDRFAKMCLTSSSSQSCSDFNSLEFSSRSLRKQ